LITALSTAGDGSRTAVKFLLADDTIFRWIFSLLPLAPLNTALLAAGLGLPVCLKDVLANNTGLGCDCTVLESFLF
jgi:hypothetical protein